MSEKVWERMKNVFTDRMIYTGASEARVHQERQRALEQGRQAATEQMRDQLLGSALAMRTEWTQSLVKDGGPNHSTDQVFSARVRELNQALLSLREVNPVIQARLEPEEIRQAAHESLERQRTQEPGSRRQVLGGSLEIEPNLPNQTPADSAERQRGYEETRANLNSQLGKSLAGITVRNWGDRSQILQEHRIAAHEIALKTSQGLNGDREDRGRGTERNSPEYYAGTREAIRDWSHQENHELLAQIQQHAELSADSSHEQRSPSRENLPVQYVEWINSEVVGISQNSVTNRVVNSVETAVETPSVELDWGVSA